MKLSIVIPQYNEDEKVIFPLLSSIDNQVAIDFSQLEILVINDCSNTLLEESFLNSFVNIKPIYIQLKENIGLGRCRQSGFDASKGEYIMYCDADDRFLTNIALYLYFQAIDNSKADLIRAKWVEEVRYDIDGKTEFKLIPHEIDSTWVHGKVFRRQFLLDKNIKFHPKFRVHEDSYFVGMASEFAEKSIFLQHETYLWCWNDNSFTRGDGGKFFIEETPTFIDSVSELCKEIENRGKFEGLPGRVAGLLLHIYFTMLDPRWKLPKHEELRKKSERDIAVFFLHFEKYYESICKEDFAEIYHNKKERFKGMPEDKGFKFFLQQIQHGKFVK